MRSAAVAGANPVLVVDDDMVSRLVLAHMLRRMGFEVVEADDLPPAIALVRGRDFSLVFSDYSMPGGTGLELFEQLRHIEHRPPFVLVTGIVDDAGAGRARVEEVDAALAKPVSTRSLRACIDSVLTEPTPGPGPDS